MNRLSFLPLLLAAILVGCHNGPPQPGPVDVTPSGPIVRHARVADLGPGDTLAYTVRWSAPTSGVAVTSYDFRCAVAASNGTWSALYGTSGPFSLPADGNSGTTTQFGLRLFAAAGTWDSATFTISVWSRAASGQQSKQPSTATWKVYRRPGAPGPIIVDSSNTVVGVLLFPTSGLKAWYARYGGAPTQPGVWDSVAKKWTTPPLVDNTGQLVRAPLTVASVPGPNGSTLFLTGTAGMYASRIQFCPFARFAGDTTAIPIQFSTMTPCKFFYADSLAAGIWHAPRAAQQQVADATCWIFTSVGGRFPVPTNASLWEVTPGVATASITVTAATCAPAMRRSAENMRLFVAHHMRARGHEVTWAVFPGDRIWRGPSVGIPVGSANVAAQAIPVASVEAAPKLATVTNVP